MSYPNTPDHIPESNSVGSTGNSILRGAGQQNQDSPVDEYGADQLDATKAHEQDAYQTIYPNGNESQLFTSTDVQLAAKTYQDIGWPVVRLVAQGKCPNGLGNSKWQLDKFKPVDFFPDSNIGIRLDDLVDIDLDWPEARKIGAAIFSDCTCSFGRKTAREGHRLVYCPYYEKEETFSIDNKLPRDDSRFATADHDLKPIEVRTGSGRQTVVPPSIHMDTGELIEWTGGQIDTMPTLEKDTLIRRAGLVAFLSVVARAYQEGNRHYTCLALSGTLLRAGFDENQTANAVLAVAKACDDEEAELRGDVRNTKDKLDRDEEVTGLPKLIELLGLPEYCLKTFKKWLGITEPNGSTHTSKSTNEDEDYSDIALGERFASQVLLDNAVYIPKTQCWYLWNGKCWELDEKKQIMSMAQNFQSQIGNKVNNKGLKRTIKSRPTRNSIVDAASVNPDITGTVTQWNQDEWLLGTPEGTVDLRTGELRTAQKSDYITRQTAVTPDPEMPTPLWDAFLKRIMKGHPEMVEYLKRRAGYALTGDVTDHKFMFAFGTGRNGKSVFVNTLFNMMGSYAKSAPASIFMDRGYEAHPEEKAMLDGARLVIASEIGAGKTWNETLLKSLSGGDPITARYLRGHYFTFKPQCKLMICGNHKPKLTSVDPAIRKRFQLVKFNEQIPDDEIDTELEEKLKAEYPGILHDLIQACLRFQNEGDGAPDYLKETSEDYMATQDELALFIEENLVEEQGSEISASEMHRLYKNWCYSSGIHEWHLKSFNNTMDERGFTHKKKKNGMKFLNCRMKGKQESKPDRVTSLNERLVKYQKI